MLSLIPPIFRGENIPKLLFVDPVLVFELLELVLPLLALIELAFDMPPIGPPELAKFLLKLPVGENV